MSVLKAPEVRELDASDIRSILGRNAVGRLAFVAGGEVDIRPLNYVYSCGRIYGRTSHDARFAQLQKLPAPVVFEVDEVQSVREWKSVIARGHFDLLSPWSERDEWENAARLLRRVMKHALDHGDPLPDRDVVFRIEVESATGRASG